MELQAFLRVESIEELTEQFAIKARRHVDYPNLVLFKYDMIDSPMGKKIVQESRGVILNEDMNWDVVSRGFDKFFNHGEGKAAEIDWSTAVAQEKLDGSFIQLYFYDKQWHVGTSGTPDAVTPVHDTETTFKELFWDTFRKQGMELPHPNFAGTTFIFELMSPYNRIVVRHPKPLIVLIGVRQVYGNFIEDTPERNGRMLHWPYVHHIRLRSFEDITKTFETMDPLQQEGYVVVDAQFNRVKVKHPGYVALHHLKGSFSRRRVAEIVAHTGKIDEILSAFPEWTDILHQAKENWDALVAELEQAYEEIKDIEDQKEFAIKAQGTQLPGAMFVVRKGSKGKKQIGSIKDYLRGMNVRKLVDLLKLEKIKIPGMINGVEKEKDA